MTVKSFLTETFHSAISYLKDRWNYDISGNPDRSCDLDERNNSTGKFKYVYELSDDMGEQQFLQKLDFFKGKCDALFWDRNKAASIRLVEIGGYGGKSGIEFSFDSEADLNHFRKNTFGLASVEPFKSLMSMNQSFQP